MLPLKNITIDQALSESVKKFPARPALVYGDSRWSYQDFDREVNLFSGCFLGWGVQKGTHVGILCESEPNALFALFGLCRIGAVPVLLNTSLRREELKALLKRTDVEFLCIGDGYKEIDYRKECHGFLEELPVLKDILYIGLSGNAESYRTLLQLRTKVSSSEVLEQIRASVLPEEDGCILFTSGTTSQPKAVVTTQFSRANSGLQQGQDQSLTETDKVCVAMPIFHCFCLSVNVMATLFYGACLCLPNSRHTEDLLTTIEQEQCTVFSSVPALFHAMMEREDFDRWNLSSLRCGFIGGSFCTPERFREIESRFGFTLLSSLGQTEATAGITTSYLTDSLETRSETVGHFMNHVEGKISSKGEVCVRGYVVMKEYYKDPVATRRAIDEEGWLHTGDKGLLTEDGNLILTGRLKEFIIRGGENISPVEIESVICDDPRIRECKAVGVPDEHYGEEVAVCIVLNDGASFPEQEVRARYEGALAHYKVPRYVCYFRDLPKSVSGKVYTGYLKRIAARDLGLSPKKGL